MIRIAASVILMKFSSVKISKVKVHLVLNLRWIFTEENFKLKKREMS